MTDTITRRSFTFTPGVWLALEALAADTGSLAPTGRKAGTPSIATLLHRLADGELAIERTSKMEISQRTINAAIKLGHFVEENGRIANPSNMEEWAIQIAHEAAERGYDPALVEEITAWVRTEADWAPR